MSIHREGDHVDVLDDGEWHSALVTRLDRDTLALEVMVIEGAREGHVLEGLAQDDERLRPHVPPS